ncbi:hypothetical protein EPA93_10520 [Ktedonosporobacter rubrisoli]|uniref:Uncharacterized protein n=1 Tax=Ktedonosporobacter rubrisoli TaxID=2509675 RepID=A0A4P6JMD8_KTERU|nr:hypothetical protein [Ktedonosporobacter rubrisoli]QBD76419.1 hypothetical protein EPA93_10520 [Ktedonosporobacter rubrisoli]
MDNTQTHEQVVMLDALNAAMHLANITSSDLLFRRAHELFCLCLTSLQRQDTPVIYSEEQDSYIFSAEIVARERQLYQEETQMNS